MARRKNISNDTELRNLPEDYMIRLQLARLKEAEENAERLKLDNDKKRIDLDKTTCNLCYIDSAEASINKALGPIASIIKNLDQILTARLNLTGEQTAIAQEVIDDVMQQIAAIDIKLSSTAEVDAERAHRSLEVKEAMQREASRSRKR